MLDGGAGEGTRTPDPIITNDVLYQLSYTGTGRSLTMPACGVQRLWAALRPNAFAPARFGAGPLLASIVQYPCESHSRFEPIP